MVFRTPYPWYIEHTSHGVLTVIHGISNQLPKVYRTPYPWHIKPPTHRISNPLPGYNEPVTHGISNHLFMVCWPLYPSHIKPPAHGMLIPWPMVYQTLSFGRNEGVEFTMRGFKIQWRKLFRGSKYHVTTVNSGVCSMNPLLLVEMRGSIYHMGFNLQCRKFDPVVNTCNNVSYMYKTERYKTEALINVSTSHYII